MRICLGSDELKGEEQAFSRSILSVYPSALFRGLDVAVPLIEFRKSLDALQHYLEGIDTLAKSNDRPRAALEAGRF